MSTTKTLGQIAFEAFDGAQDLGDPGHWHQQPVSVRTWWGSSANAVRAAVLAESKAASDILHASLVTLSMEVTKMEALREECRQKDLIIQELRSPLPTQAPEGQRKPITFYELKHYFFSNFSSFMVHFEGRDWMTSEHAYQAMKFDSHDLQEQVRQQTSAHTAMKLAQSMKDKYRPDWEWVKVPIMKNICRAKLEQHPYIQKKLMETGDRVLVESSPIDPFWGWGPNKDGRNELGKVWMELREELRSDYAPNDLRTRAESAEARVKMLEGELRIEKSHSETAEDTIKRLEGELSEAKQDLYETNESYEKAAHDRDTASRDCRRLVEERGAAQKQAPPWIPVSTPPTDSDCNDKYQVLVPSADGGLEWTHAANLVDGSGFSVWLPASFLPPLPPSKQTEEETERKVFEVIAVQRGNSIERDSEQPEMYAVARTHQDWKLWKCALTAARQSPTKKASQS